MYIRARKHQELHNVRRKRERTLEKNKERAHEEKKVGRKDSM